MHLPTAPPGPMPVLATGDGWIVVGKPAQLLTHRTPLSPREREAAVQRVRDQIGKHVYPIHRLDRAASGCLLFATDRERVASLQASLSSEATEKTYVALVRGCVPAGERVYIDRPLKGKEAATTAEVLGSCEEPRCSVLAARIFTGRYHQIRRHLARISHPIVRDSTHGDTKINLIWRERGLVRLGLHAWRLRVELEDGGRIDATCPIADDLLSVLEVLPFWPEAAERLRNLPPLPRIPEAAPDAGFGGTPKNG